MDVRRANRLSARLEHRAREPRARAARIRPVAGAAEEPADAGDGAGAAGGAKRPDEPAAGRVSQSIARAAGEEARGRGEEDGGGHGTDVLRLPGAARSRARADGGNPGYRRL